MLDNVNITHITEVTMAMSSRVMITMMAALDYTKITQEQEKEAEREREAREMKEQSCKKNDRSPVTGQEKNNIQNYKKITFRTEHARSNCPISKGGQFCPGAQLARAQISIVLE